MESFLFTRRVVLISCVSRVILWLAILEVLSPEKVEHGRTRSLPFNDDECKARPTSVALVPPADTLDVEHHTLHHSRYNYNYGLYFRWWDRWFDTEAPLTQEKHE